MITKLNIDALVASKFDLYKSNEHFKHFNLTQMHSTIRDEIESLCDLADQRVCIKRCNRFNIKGTRPDDYRERIIYLDEDLFFLAGIRFQGLDVTKPFVSVHANFSEFNNTQILKITELLKKKFEIFSPQSFHVTYPQGVVISTHDFQIDRYTVVGVIKELVQLELVPTTDEIELILLSEMNFYDEYVKEYALLYTKSPFLRSEVKTENLESLNDSAKDGLLFEVQINGKCAGVIAGYIEDYYGQKEVCILEELLFESFRGKGLGVYLQKAFAIKMLDRFNLLWGHISDLNPSSLKTALKNGRKITEIEYIFSLDNFKIIKTLPEELDCVYMMGFDAWSEGATELEYLNLCRSSTKYKNGQWYVLKNNSELLSSLIIYKFDENTFGIGSISTPSLSRKKGLASKLISGIIEMLENEYSARNIYLYSDIDPAFYEKFGFAKLPQNCQRYKTTTCMVLGDDFKKNLTGGEIYTPEYF